MAAILDPIGVTPAYEGLTGRDVVIDRAFDTQERSTKIGAIGGLITLRPKFSKQLINIGKNLGNKYLKSSQIKFQEYLDANPDLEWSSMTRLADDLAFETAEMSDNLGPRNYTSDLRHVTGRTAQRRNMAIRAMLNTTLRGMRATFRPIYSPFLRTGIAKRNIGTQIGKKEFHARKELARVIIHEELHQS